MPRTGLKAVSPATIVFNRKITPSCHIMRLRLDNKASDALDSCKPGQFAMLKLSDNTYPFLPRPFGILRTHKMKPHGTVVYDVLYQVVGEGTRYMAALKPETRLSSFGPLGNGFTVPANADAHAVIAGGIGIAGVFMLINELSRMHCKTKAKPGAPEVRVFYGARSSADLALLDELKKTGAKITVATEDGSLGDKGYITESYHAYASKFQGKKNIQVYACGPDGMLKAVATAAKEHRHRCQLSLDRRMACGIGVCRGCVCKTRSNAPDGFSYSAVCTDGPVFDAETLFSAGW